MSGRRNGIKRSLRPGLALCAVSCLALLPGCTDFRRAIGLERTGPDEFAVESRAPLTMPPDYDLRPPKPGAIRPQEGNAADRARKVVDAAGPGEPGKQQVPALKANGVGAAEESNPNQTGSAQSLAGKLLNSGDSPSSGTADTRQTTPMKGVY